MNKNDIHDLIQAVLHSNEDDLKNGLRVVVEALHAELERRVMEKAATR